ncbi:hypothetical protein O3M35_005192 [Rhynocoris fuscipes]|uniref:Uncharacterized protein n=1 Tax=Rhynocoris fuscipes TaxID=488301 RepID=A0AAW1DIP3_9HEMI
MGDCVVTSGNGDSSSNIMEGTQHVLESHEDSSLVTCDNDDGTSVADAVTRKETVIVTTETVTHELTYVSDLYFVT